MLTDDQLAAIKAQYGACNDNALREAAELGYVDGQKAAAEAITAMIARWSPAIRAGANDVRT